MGREIEECADPFVRAIVDAARGWIGTPYRHQASVKGAGADCLGLVRGIWRDVLGPEPASIPSYTPDWSEAAGDEALMRSADRWLVRRSGLEWQVADILLFRMRHDSVAKHLGVVSAPFGSCRFIHAYTGHGVVESPLSEPWRRRVAAVYHFPKGA
jgi:NlpC/P60 family putative phage cell wall peptidase